MKTNRPYSMSTRADAVAATRDRIVRSAKDLFLEQPFEDVTLAAIASAASVSHQTVLNHYESKEGVALAVAELLAEETSAARGEAVPGDPAGAVHVLVGDYEHMGDANVRWAATSERMGSLASALDDARAYHQQWLETVFGDRLPKPAAARRRARNALHVAPDAYTWKLLRRDLGLSRAETEKTMVDLVVGILRGAEA
jgi:AcrR family transcriptional regulator